MRYSTLFTKTTKDIPSDETSKNAQLLIRAGFVHKTMAGVYSYLPLGLRVLGKIENIVRKNMNSIGGQEMLMNSLHPKEWWLKASRWDNVDILFKLKSQTKSEYALACSHEEQVVPIASTYIHSYKDLPNYNPETGTSPLSVYQIHTKFRDELRAKSGLLRGREFRMKDMYDFHSNKVSQDTYYELVKNTYTKVYTELGLTSYPTTASGGIFTTNISHEFQVECEAGEDWIYQDSTNKEVYNEEMAPCEAPLFDYSSENEQPKTDHFLDGVIGVEALIEKLNLTKTKTTKTLFFEDHSKNLIVAVVRGDRNVNEAKLMNISGKMLGLASEETVLKNTGCGIGYAGIINLPVGIETYFDTSLEKLKNFETGTNKQGYHTTNVCFGRDIPYPKEFVDISEVQPRDTHPVTKGLYNRLKTAEVGNIFKLDDKYTKAFGVTFADENNQMQTPLMNCHGIGTSRCLAIIAEIYSDENGLKWPTSVAPFTYHIVSNINKKDDLEVQDKILAIAEGFYEGQLKLTKNEQGYGIINTRNWSDISSFMLDETVDSLNTTVEDVLWDDRINVSMGEKFKDADLIGCPIQIIVSKKSLENGGVEIKNRQTGETFSVNFDNLG